jgi:hypothetical protein
MEDIAVSAFKYHVVSSVVSDSKPTLPTLTRPGLLCRFKNGGGDMWKDALILVYHDGLENFKKGH